MRGRAPMTGCTRAHEQTRRSPLSAAEAKNASGLLRAIHNHITATDGEPPSPAGRSCTSHSFLPVGEWDKRSLFD